MKHLALLGLACSLACTLLLSGCAGKSDTGKEGPDAPGPEPTAPQSWEDAAQDLWRLEELKPEVQQQFAPAPTGFSWRIFKNVAFLLPDGWTEQTGATQESGLPWSVYTATAPDAFQGEGLRLSIKLLQDARSTHGQEVRVVSKAWLASLGAIHAREDFTVFDREEKQGREVHHVRYRERSPQGQAMMVHQVILASEAADTVHVLLFASPEAQWQANWDRYGAVILQHISLAR